MNMKEARRRHRAAKKAGTTEEPFRKWARKSLRKVPASGKLAAITAVRR